MAPTTPKVWPAMHGSQHGGEQSHIATFYGGQTSNLEDLSIPLFVKGYLIIMKGEGVAIKDNMATHLEELMTDSELYSWQRVTAYHSVWLNQIEQG